MEVFLTFRDVDYEGSDVLGVYATEELAIQAMHDYVKGYDSDYYRWSWHETDKKYDAHSLTVRFQKFEVQE